MATNSSEYMRAYRKGKDRSAENNTPAAVARIKRWRSKNRAKCLRGSKAAHIRGRYGIDLPEYEARLKSQHNRCALCGKPFHGKYHEGYAPVLDHSHSTGELRKFIHRRCNAAIGYLNDDPYMCRLAAEYLEKHTGD